MQCFGHRLNLAVRKSVKDSDLKEAIPRMKKVVRHFKSHKQREALKKAQVCKEYGCNLKLTIW